MKSNGDDRGIIDRPDSQSDQSRPLTPKQRGAGLARIDDPSAPEYHVARRAGYSHWTARAPQRNGIDSFEFAGRVADEAEITPAQAKRIGLGTLAGLATNEQESGGTRGAASKALLDYATATGQDDSDLGDIRSSIISLYIYTALHVLKALDIAVKSPEKGQRLMSRILDRLAEWDREHRTTGRSKPSQYPHTDILGRAPLLSRLAPDEHWYLECSDYQDDRGRGRHDD